MINKLKTALFSILPIIAFVLLIHLFVGKVDTNVLLCFLIGSVILIVGQAVFLTGIENSIEPMGEFVGGAVSTNKRFYIFLIFGLVFGLFSTIAEPDMQVFATKVVIAGFNINKFLFLIVAGFGVGAFISIALLRLAFKASLNIVLFISYLIVVVLAAFSSESGFCMSLDAGANTTGVVTSPFLLALGVGVARLTSSNKNSADEDSFGLIALSSVGPIIAVLILNIIINGSSAPDGVLLDNAHANTGVLVLIKSTLLDVAFSIIPLVVVFFVFEALFIKISRQEKKKLMLGSVITFVGFFLFLFGIELGLTSMGEAIGFVLGKTGSVVIISVITALLSFFIVFSEPSIRILSKKIEEVTNGTIRSTLVLVATGISIMLATVLVVLRIEYNISIWWYVGVVYGLAFLLMIIVPKMFSAVAFDSSGVATGTLTVAFIFPIMMGVSGGKDSFGVIAILTMVPILVMQVIGLMYILHVRVDNRVKRKMLVNLSKTEDKFSNVKKLKTHHELNYGSDI